MRSAVISLILAFDAADAQNTFGCGACPGECVGGLCLQDFAAGLESANAAIQNADMHIKNAAMQNAEVAAVGARGWPSPGGGSALAELQSLQLMQEAQESGPVDPLHAPLEAFMHMHEEPHLGKEMQLLQAQIEAAHATENAVSAQNQALRKELEGWRVAGEQVAQHEGRIVDLVHQLRGDQPKEGMMALLGQRVAHAEDDMVHDPRGYLVQLAIFVFVGVALLFGASLKDRVLAMPAKQVVTCGAWGCCMAPMLRRAGMSRYAVEVSEINICLPSTPSGGDICVTVQMGRDSCLRTTSAESVADSAVYKFRDVFRLDVGKSDGLCVFGVIDRDSPGTEVQKLARLEITAEDLLKAAHQQGTEYFRYGLSCSLTKSPLQMNGMIDEDGDVEHQPYLAMKIRDVSGSGSRPSHAGVQKSGLHMYGHEACPGNFGTFSS